MAKVFAEPFFPPGFRDPPAGEQVRKGSWGRRCNAPCSPGNDRRGWHLLGLWQRLRHLLYGHAVWSPQAPEVATLITPLHRHGNWGEKRFSPVPRVPDNSWKFYPQVRPSRDQPCPKSASPGTPECLWAPLTAEPHSSGGKETVDLKSFSKRRWTDTWTIFMDSSERKKWGNEGRERPLSFRNTSLKYFTCTSVPFIFYQKNRNFLLKKEKCCSMS